MSKTVYHLSNISALFILNSVHCTCIRYLIPLAHVHRQYMPFVQPHHSPFNSHPIPLPSQPQRRIAQKYPYAYIQRCLIVEENDIVAFHKTNDNNIRQTQCPLQPGPAPPPPNLAKNSDSQALTRNRRFSPPRSIPK